MCYMYGVRQLEIQATYPEKLIAFYGHVFDWKFIRSGAESLGSWIITVPMVTQSGILVGGLVHRRGSSPKRFARISECFSVIAVDHFEQYQEKILKAGGVVAVPKMVFPSIWWRGYFLDPMRMRVRFWTLVLTD